MDFLDKCSYIEENCYGISHFDDLKLVLKYLDDSDELVRIEMIEACYACEQEVIHDKLLCMLETAEGLEKGNILLTLSYIFQDDKERIIGYLKEYMNSVDIYEKMDSYAGLIIIGEGSYLEVFLDFLKSNDYAIRCATANMLSEFIQNNLVIGEDILMVRDYIISIKERENTRAVKSSIDNLLIVIDRVLLERKS